MSELNYTLRTHCIFCLNLLKNTYFEKDYDCQVAHYMVDLNDEHFITIPFNVYQCDYCNTVQTKYLGNLNDIYKINHADSTGKIMVDLHEITKNLLLKYKDNIKNIIEIGSSKGILADIILKNIETEYNIIEPCYWGDKTNKNVINDFYENVDDSHIDANTMIISHVFEHFYKPMEILDKIYANKNIEYFLLVFPDLEYYINNKNLHVLNTEHTYYIDNQFLIQLLKNRGFNLLDSYYHENHSVIFYFQREVFENKLIDFKNTNYSLDTFYGNIFKKIAFLNNIIEKNTEKNIYFWPASIHTIYLSAFGLSDKFYGYLDNSLNKIGKKVYGTNKEIFSFSQIIEANDKNTVIILNGGVFNREIEEHIKKSNNITFY